MSVKLEVEEYLKMEPELLYTLVSLAASTVISTVIGTIIKRAINKKLDKNIKDQQELVNLRAEKERQERKADVTATFREEFRPLDEKLDKLSASVDLSMAGTVTLLRESMKQTRDQFVKQGYVSASDYASWHELYNTYKKLGGNHFKEYVDAWKADVESLPREIIVDKN